MRVCFAGPSDARAGVVVMCHGPGVDRFVETKVEELARHGYAAAAPDVFHRQPDDGADTMARVGRLRDTEIAEDVDATVEQLRARGVERLAVIGFCMGGRNTYLLAGARPALWRAAVDCYGGNLRVPWGGEVAPFDLTERIACPLLGIFGADDTNPSPADVEALDAALCRADKPHEFHSYDGAGHAFLNFTNAERFRPAQADDAWSKLLAFLDRYTS
jgi:carboxymethylenebutenolidase